MNSIAQPPHSIRFGLRHPSRCAWVAAAVFLRVASSGLGAGEGILLEQRLSSHSILKAPPAELVAGLGAAVQASPKSAGRYITAALSAGRADTDEIAPSAARTALLALENQPSKSEVADVVRSTVKAAPTEVLEIVRVAVKAVPRGEAKTVVAAAVSAVPDPQKMVSLAAERRLRTAGDGKSDGKDFKDMASNPEAKQMTLAEAIVNTAMEADPSLSMSELTAAVDHAMSITFTSLRQPDPNPLVPPAVSIVPGDPRTPGSQDLRGVVANPGVASP